MQTQNKRFPLLVIGILLLCILALILYNVPPVHDRLAWRVDALRARIKYAFSPPEQAVFVPQTQETITPPVSPAASSYNATETPTPIQTSTATPPPVNPANSPTPTFTPTLTPTPIPAEARLDGFRHEYQRWNNCGPANLAIALSYWGWDGTQQDTAVFLKPNDRDKNVMPYEMANYVEEQTGLRAMIREGGDLETIKALIAAGFPVIVEKGFEGAGFDDWMGHYEVVSGYEGASERFFAQDTYKGPDLPVPYDEFINQWRAFNYLYLVIYPPEQETKLQSVLGLQFYENFNQRYAEQKARQETSSLEGRDLFFALFNQGTNQVNLRDYTAAATAYDAAFANYPLLPAQERPWRMLWYQTGPYFAYYYTGRYQDVIDLATTTLGAMSEPILEESYYWRAKAYLAAGDNEAAIQDLRQCLKVHPDFNPCVDELGLLGIEP